MPPTPPPPTEWTLALLQEMEWRRFESLCIAFFKARGFATQATQRDQECGLAVRLYRAGEADCHAVAYCKNWHARLIGVDRIRVLYDLMVQGRIARGYYLTNARYAPEAIEFASGIGMRLLDARALLAQIRLLPDRQQHLLLQLTTSGDYRTPTCAACEQKMVRHSEDKSIWRCSAYPGCKHRLVFPRELPHLA